jgi:dTDP-4-dehydrorhamnose reductase
MKKVIFGAGKVSHILDGEGVTILNRGQCDIGELNAVRQALDAHQPSVVINCAAKTNLEYCEENREEAYISNTVGAAHLMMACAERNIFFAHISSGCLFDGNQEVMTEKSVPTPAVWYTRTKNWADEFIQHHGYDRYLILRPRQIISAVPHPTNMLTKFAQYEDFYVHEEPNSITCLEDMKEMIEHLLTIQAHGIYNCVNDGVISPYEVALGVKEYINPPMNVMVASYEHTLTLQPNKRVNTILSNEKLHRTGFQPRDCRDALKWCLKNYE